MKKHIHGGDVYRHQNVIDFSANCNPLGTPASVKRAVAESMKEFRRTGSSAEMGLRI